MMDSNAPARKRITPQSTCPNPLFEQWLEEWQKEAADRNLDLQYCFGKALQSLRKYPLKLRTGQECLILKNFGSQLAVKLDRKLAEYRKTHPDDSMASSSSTSGSMPVEDPHALRNIPEEVLKPKRRKGTTQPTTVPTGTNNSSSRSPKGDKAYVPTLRSGPHAILSTMLKEQENISYPGFMLKTEIIRKAADLCDSSFTRPDPGKYYTAWSSMSTLIQKGFVTKRGNPAKYSLTEKGEALARKLLDPNFHGQSSTHASHITPFSSPGKSSVSTFHTSPYASSPRNLEHSEENHSILQDYSPPEDDDIYLMNEIPSQDYVACDQNSPLSGTDYLPSNGDSNSDQQLIFQPGDFNILLLVDKREMTGNRGNQIIEETTRELKRLKTDCEVRHLKIGDFAWVARNKENKELVLPYIVERKRMDDLGGSIKDGRFHEQKFRLRQCGLQNVIYLVEKFGNEARLGLPINSLHQAVVNSQVTDDFFTKITNSHKESMFYLSVLTKFLTNIFKDKTLISCARSELPVFNIDAELVSLPTFEEFSTFSVKNKNLKVRDMFMKQLLQLKGCSVEKASVIVHKYPTPRILKQAFTSSSKPETMLANLTFGVLNRNIGPTLSKSIYYLYTRRTFT